MLLLSVYYLVLEILGGKKDLILVHGFKHGKIVFILLNEIIIIYVKLILINVKSLRLKRSFLRLFEVFLSTKKS